MKTFVSTTPECVFSLTIFNRIYSKQLSNHVELHQYLKQKQNE